MPYFNIKSSPISFGQLNNIGLSVGNQTSNTNSTNEFYELEPAIVLDVILDETHSEIVNKRHLVDIRNIPANYKNELPNQKDIDYSYIGACRVRLCFSQQGLEKEKLSWAFPMESTGIVEYPLLNEVVIVVKYFTGLSTYIDSVRKGLPQDGDLNNIVDEISGLVNSTIYKLKFLK